MSRGVGRPTIMAVGAGGVTVGAGGQVLGTGVTVLSGPRPTCLSSDSVSEDMGSDLGLVLVSVPLAGARWGPMIAPFHGGGIATATMQ